MDRRSFTFGLTAATTALLGARRALAAGAEALTPEMFGAKGDGRSDDSAAFARLGEAVSAAGGGRVVLRHTTYLVGRDAASAPRRFFTTPLLEITRCSRAVTIEGNGARLRCPDGQRYGAFPMPDARQGAPDAVFTPYRQMILIANCTGPVSVADLELDGNLDGHVLGGKRGDTGWQIPCIGLMLRDNVGAESVRNVYSHHHALDGFYVDGIDADTPGTARTLEGLRADINGRQGLSLVGGRGYRIANSSFTRTGRGKIASSPLAGVDIEAERRKLIRDIHFANCRIADNVGCGLVADTGDSADVTFTGCLFVGTTNWALWPKKPRFVFRGCTIAGTLIHAFGSDDPALATRFEGCTFSDDPALSPTGRLHLYGNVCAYLPYGTNVLFSGCTFRMRGAGRLPSTRGAIFADCTMEQRDPQPATPRGTFRGTNRITGAVKLMPSTVTGTLIVNGQRVTGQP